MGRCDCIPLHTKRRDWEAATSAAKTNYMTKLTERRKKGAVGKTSGEIAPKRSKNDGKRLKMTVRNQFR